MSNNRFEELDYFIFCTTNERYIENTYVSLKSFYEYNDYPVTVFLIDCETNRFDEFEKVSTEKLDFEFLEKHHHYQDAVKPIIAKIKIFGDSKHSYNLSFDTDTLFVGKIDDAIQEYKDNLIGSCEIEKGTINAGFMIYHKTEKINLFEKFEELRKSHGFFNCPEETFLNFVFKDSREFISKKFNTNFWTGEVEDAVMIHYAGINKPFSFFNLSYPYLMVVVLKDFKRYYDFCEKLQLSEEFKKDLEKSKKNYEWTRTLFHHIHKRV